MMRKKFFYSNFGLIRSDTIKTHRFNFLLILLLPLVILGVFMNIPCIHLIIIYYLFLFFTCILKKYVKLNKYLKVLLSESNLSIRFIIPIITYLLFDFNKVILCSIKFFSIILIRLYYIDKLSSKSIIITLIFCIFSSFVSPLTSICYYELFILHMNPSNNNKSDFWIWMRPQNETSLPTISNPEQELKELQEYLKTTEHGTNYEEIIPTEPNDFNTAKANNAFNDIQKKAQSFPGRVEIAWRAGKLLNKIKNEGFIDDGLPIHSKLTYNELSVLKFFGKHFHLEKISGYNGIAQMGLFTGVEPNNIEIAQPISSNSVFGKCFEREVYYYRKNIKAQLKAIDSKVWVID